MRMGLISIFQSGLPFVRNRKLVSETLQYSSLELKTIRRSSAFAGRFNISIGRMTRSRVPSHGSTLLASPRIFASSNLTAARFKRRDCLRLSINCLVCSMEEIHRISIATDCSSVKQYFSMFSALWSSHSRAVQSLF
jgi:hypothetical protein